MKNLKIRNAALLKLLELKFKLIYIKEKKIY